VFGRGSSDAFVGGEAPLEQVEMLKLLDAFQGVLERTHRTREHQIDFERFSLSEKISELSDRLRECGRLVFHELFVDHASRAELIITFLALLEMTRLRLTRLRQDGPMEPIYIELTVADEEAGVAAVYEEVGAPVLDEEAVAASEGGDPIAIDPDVVEPDASDPDLGDPTADHPADIQLDPPDRGDLEEYE
jgi:segregation and condensation protein A